MNQPRMNYLEGPYILPPRPGGHAARILHEARIEREGAESIEAMQSREAFAYQVGPEFYQARALPVPACLQPQHYIGSPVCQALRQIQRARHWHRRAVQDHHDSGQWRFGLQLRPRGLAVRQWHRPGRDHGAC
jgi:hypothetical protein